MAPTKGKKRQSGASVTSNKPDTSGAGAVVKAAKAGSPQIGTPKRSSPKSRIRLTQSQKQALMDNLQLEITERARKLRAQYALQAQSLRTRLEIRVHRIPVSLRKTSIAELLDKNSAVSDQPQPVSSQAQKKPITSDNTAMAGGKKRKSDELDEGKENDTAAPQSASKKRNQAKQSRTADPSNAARRVPPSQILSPKSNNARNFPHSPYKPTMSPTKTAAARPNSPLKPSTALQRGTSQTKAADNASKAKPAASRAASKQKTIQKNKPVTQGTTRRGAAAETNVRPADEEVEDESRRRSNVSEATNTSSSTTIVKTTRKAPMAVSASRAATKGKVAGIAGKFEGIAANGKRLAAPKPAAKSARPATTTTGRTLRKR